MINLIATIFHFTLFVGVVIFCIVNDDAVMFFIPAMLITFTFGCLSLYLYLYIDLVK